MVQGRRPQFKRRRGNTLAWPELKGETGRRWIHKQRPVLASAGNQERVVVVTRCFEAGPSVKVDQEAAGQVAAQHVKGCKCQHQEICR